jgi:hypothetical protein
MSRTASAFADDDDGEDECVLTKVEEKEKLVSLEQIKNQKRIKHEIKEKFLTELGGWPTIIDNKEVKYAGVEVMKLWDNHYRVNLKISDKHGNIKRPYSAFTHYQLGNISWDTLTPVKKLFSNYPLKEESTNA